MLGYIHFPSWLKPEIIPGLPIRWYGMMYLTAFTVAYLLVKIQVKEKSLEVNKDDVLNLFFWAIIGLLVGARLFSVIIYDPEGYYVRHPLQIFLPFSMAGGKLHYTGLAGMSYHGGLLGTIIACVIYLRVKKFNVLDWCDMIVTGASLGYTFGRLGNFINGALYGRVTSQPWGIVFPLAKKFPAGNPLVQQIAGNAGMDITGLSLVNLPRHPSQLYEAFFEGIVIWAILWFIFRKRKAFNGMLVSLYVIGYGLFRFFIEYVREPDAGIGYPIQFITLKNPDLEFSFLNFTTGQILNFIMILGGIICFIIFKRLSQKGKLQELKPTLRKLRKKIH